jgi:hypothetical protein
MEFSTASSSINVTITRERLSNETHPAKTERGIAVIRWRDILVVDKNINSIVFCKRHVADGQNSDQRLLPLRLKFRRLVSLARHSERVSPVSLRKWQLASLVLRIDTPFTSFAI